MLSYWFLVIWREIQLISGNEVSISVPAVSFNNEDDRNSNKLQQAIRVSNKPDNILPKKIVQDNN